MVKAIYSITLKLPPEERFNLTQQLRRAALSVKLNIAEGASRNSIAERRRFYEISRSSIVEIDAGLETAIDLGYINELDTTEIDNLLNRVFSLLTGLMNASK